MPETVDVAVGRGEQISPRVVIGVPLYNKVGYVRSALESLLNQTYRGFAIVLVDDGSDDGTVEIVEKIVRDEPRADLSRNPERLGLAANWRRCVQVSRKRFPDAEYFAWGSDHDLWEPDWLEELVGALDADADAVLAYPFVDSIDENGVTVATGKRTLSTAGIHDVRARVRATYEGMAAGNMVYGLFRVDQLEAAGIFRSVRAPDRLLLVELAFRGRFVQVERVLWHRRFRKLFSVARQRRAIFPHGIPKSAFLPQWLTHVGTLFSVYVVHERGRPLIGRRLALLLCWDYLRAALSLSVRRGRKHAYRFYKYNVRRPARRVRKSALRYGFALRSRASRLVRPLRTK